MVDLWGKEVLDNAGARGEDINGRDCFGFDASDKVGQDVLALSEGLVVRS